MSVPASREDLKNWCLKQLGHPVHDINIDLDQLDDNIDSALQYFQDFHFDGMERWYLKHAITADDITNQYIPITGNIFGVTRVFPFNSSGVRMNMFDLRYQMRLNDLANFTATSYVYFVQTQQHIRMLDMLFAGEIPIRYNRHTDKLYLDYDWSKVVVGQYFIVEGYVIVDPNVYTKVYNDRLLKRLATAHVKRQWASNMRKYVELELPGGAKMNAEQFYKEAQEEIERVEELIRTTYECPPEIVIG
jgi:hypothetical protein